MKIHPGIIVFLLFWSLSGITFGQSLKNRFMNLAPEISSEKDFVTKTPALKLTVPQPPGKKRYALYISSTGYKGKTIQLDLQVKRTEGKAGLTVCFRSFASNKLVSSKKQTFQLGDSHQWQKISAVFTVPENPDLSGTDALLEISDFGSSEKCVILIDDPCIRIVERRNSAIPADSIGMEQEKIKEPLILVKNGKICFSIVVPDIHNPIAAFAANEIASHVKEATGQAVKIVTESQADPTPAIYLGDTKLARKYGINPQRLSPSQTVLARIGGNIVISGGDCENARQSQVVSRDAIPLGTLFAAYEFLEQFFGVRFYWPGKYGTVVPKAENIQVDRLFSFAVPAYKYRNVFYVQIPGISYQEQCLWFRRLRLTGGYAPIANHSYNQWPEKFASTHPEYFVLQPDGKRKLDSFCGGHVCFSNPDVLKETIREKLDFFRKNPDETAASVMPGDSNITFYCRCPECQKELKPEWGENGAASRHVWNFVNKVAAAVAKEMPGRYIKCAAYPNYQRYPDIKLNPNVIVTLCLQNTTLANLKNKQRYIDMIRQWASTGARLYLWEYWMPRQTNGTFGAPAVFPRHLKEMYLLDQYYLDGKIIQFPTHDADGKTTTSWPNWIYDVQNLYFASELLWNPNFDIEKGLEEYYTAFYGPAAPEIRQFYNEMEQAWCRTDNTGGWNYETCWLTVYTPEFVDRMMGLLRKAVQKTGNREPYYSRAQMTLQGYLPFEHRSMMTRKQNQERNNPDIKVPVAGVPPVIDGNLNEKCWEKAAVISNFHDLFNMHAVSAKTEFRFLQDHQNLYVGIRAAYPGNSKIKWAPAQSASRDALLSVYESAELFFAGQGEDCIQFIIAPDKRLSDYYWQSPDTDYGTALKWNAENLCVATRKGENYWDAEIAIPLRTLRVKPCDDNSFRVNFGRNYQFFDDAGIPQTEFSCWQPTYGPFRSPNRFGKIHLK